MAELDRRIAAFDEEFAASARQDEAARRLATVPGIGPINATALVAAVGDASTFGRARDLAAWLGLVPKQATTGGRPRLLGITKRGNRYLRKNLIHGARAVLPPLAVTGHALGDWLRGLLERAHKNTVVVALANKLARIAWAVLARGGGDAAAAAAEAASKAGRAGTPVAWAAEVCGRWDGDGLTVESAARQPDIANGL